MYRNKKDVDKHVENLLTKLSAKEFKTRAYSIARLYFEVEDYANCQKYVEQYLTHNASNAASYKLLGQALQKLGQKEKALEKYKISLDIDPVQTSTILDICELLADDEVSIEPGRAKYWCEKAEAIYPRHPVIFRLRERLMALPNSDPEALINLLTTELAIRPKDASLHARLLKHYMNANKIKEAFDHSCNIELTGKTFINNYAWYEVLNEILKHNSLDPKNWLYQLLLLTVKERICLLSIAECPSGSSQSLIESGELLHAYDQAIEVVAQAGTPPGFGEFHSSLLQHHRGQFVFHAATYLLKKAKKDQLKWYDAKQSAAPLMLIAWQTVPLDSNVNWLKSAPEKQVTAVKRWYSEGAYRCSQAGHYLLANIQDKYQRFLDQVSQSFAGTGWRDKLYQKIFANRNHLAKSKTSHFASSNALGAPVLRLPRKVEVEAYDCDAQREYGNSLHHFVWILLNYKNYAQFKLTLFETLKLTATACGAESLNKLDVEGFLYSAAITARQQLSNGTSYLSSEKPSVLPANITDLLCPLRQMKWWDCAYKFFQNELGTELTDIRATLTRGIEVVRCIDNHGLDPELLCMLGRIFNERCKVTTDIDEKNQLETRAVLYYSSAIPLLEKIKSKFIVKIHDKRLFDYTHKEFSTKELNALLEESKLQVAGHYLKEGEYDKVIELLSTVKSPQSYLHLGLTYKKIATDEDTLHKSIDAKPRMVALLSKARTFAYKAISLLKNNDVNKNDDLYSDSQQLIEEIETQINKQDLDMSNVTNDLDRCSSDENISGDNLQIRSNTHIFRNISSTPKATSNANHNNTNYRTAVDSHILETTRVEQQHLERIEREIQNLQKRDVTINDFMGQTKDWFDENRRMGIQIISTIQSNMQNTTDQFKLLKISVDQVKDQIDQCRNECKDVGDMKKQIAELKKEVSKLKKPSSEHTIDDSDLYNLEEEYRTNDSTSSFANQLPFTPAQMMHQFGQRLVPPFSIPPNPYQLYNQSLYNLYNQYSQFAQPSTVPGAQPIFDPNRGQMNYQGVFPASDQMYLDVAHLVPPTVPPAPIIPQVPVGPSLSTVPSAPNVSLVTVPPPVSTITTSKPTSTLDAKDVPKPLPVNVVITSSDPLPTSTTAPAPILSVTIPQKHIKGIPHNYQIPMPSTNETKTISPPVFVFPPNQANSSASSLTNWNQASVFKTSISTSSTTPFNPIFTVPKIEENLDASKSVVDGIFKSPNTSLNKSRTLSERSNTSVENYDPCPDFKPIVPLPAEVKVTTGEEDESVIFSARAKLYRFVDKQWKERGLGDMKLLKHKVTGKVRVLMRREQVHKICANHIITGEMEIKAMKNETKAYFWVANDFADERVVLEKFCIRFKTADIALDFYKQFEKAQSECETKLEENETENTSSVTPKTPTEPLTIHKKEIPEKTNVAPVGKAVIGGFTFSGTPTFKPVSEDTTLVTKPQESAPKTSVFGSLSFNKTTTTPFSNLFTTTAKPSSAQSQTQEVSNKLNSSDTLEEFEPNVEFKPVVPLPALVEQKTGEEDEIVLFEHRAKLLRFDAPTKEWKERGIGNIKLLAHKDNKQKIRLLMRREQIMKVCCNHALTVELVFQKMPNLDKAVTWCAKDFSEGELVTETFCLRFKTVQACNDFIEAVNSAQLKLKEDPKVEKEAKTVLQQNKQSGFGDAFKPKAGSWHCDTCYTNNLESFLKCACCDTPKPSNSATETKSETVATVGWGDKFKPKVGSWECKECFVRNEQSLENCSACNSPKDPSKGKPAISLISNNAPKFNFGIPKTDSKSNETPSIFGNVLSDKPVQFGISPSAGHDDKQKSEPASIFGGTGGQKFNFGIPSSTTVTVITAAPFGDQKSKANNLFMNQKTNFGEQPIDFSAASVDKESITETPALRSTPQKDNTTGFTFKEGGTFDFVFKLKTPVKSPNRDDGDESDDNANTSEDCAFIPFSPVIPMPDKVEVVTGEENEIELYGHLAKLFRFASGEWKERGRGIVKILKHKETGKLRVVMRREQVLKICLNHALTPEITYTPKDDKTWLFAANDYSEGELSLQQFCLRFKQKEIALEFKDAIDKARDGKLDGPAKDIKPKTDKDDEDVVFVSEIQATKEEKEKAKALMLPENFFTYMNKEPCHGCRGCDDSDGTNVDNKSDQVTNKVNDPEIDIKPPVATTTAAIKHPILASVQASTPFKTSPTSVQSPTSSIYGTPTNMEKTLNNSIFRTPAEIIDTDSDDESTNKENTFIQKPTMFSGFGEKKNLFGSSQSSLKSIFSGSDTQTPISYVLAPPKLMTSTEKQEVDPKSIFGTAQVKAMTMTTENKSIFANTNLGTNDKSNILDNKDDNQVSEAKTIFGGDNKNLFTQGSIFGSTVTNVQPKSTGSIFESTGGVSVFGGGKSIFGATSTVFGKNETEQKTPEPTSIFNTKTEEVKEEPEVAELPFKVDNTFSFSALSSQTSGEAKNSFQKAADFKWEGAGQQLFGSANKDNVSKNHNVNDGETNAGADEEYDPHYEPIVPLPDKIAVTTGEEDEKKLFGERCKLYRYDETTREWKERGIGEMKILYHPEKMTYRLLLRREQVHKAVLNMLLYMDLELLPMKNSDRAWTWAGRNYAENPAGAQETLAVRFKSVDLATDFRAKVTECARKLQSAAAKAISEEREANEKAFGNVPPLRLPKHLQDSARADPDMSAAVSQSDTSVSNENKSVFGEVYKQVHFQEGQEGQEHGDDEEEYNQDYDAYYNEEEDESGAYYSCEGEAHIQQGDLGTACSNAYIQVLFDQEIYSPKILVTDASTGEILADMLIHTETEFQMNGDSCVWSGTDYTSNDPVDKTVTIYFYDSDTAMQFYDSCETSKAATYSSTDPES